MKLKEFLQDPSKPKLFATYAQQFDPPWLADYDPSNYDYMLERLYGEREFFEPVAQYDIPSLAKVFNNLFGDAWDNLFTAFNSVNLGASDVETVKETGGSTTTRTNERTSTDALAGFNTSDMVDDKRTTENGNADEDVDTTRNVERAHSSLSTLNNNLTLVDKISIMNKVVGDVAKFMTLPIY